MLKKAIGYLLIIFGLLFFFCIAMAGVLVGAMSTDAGDDTYLLPIIIISCLVGVLVAYFCIKTGWKLRSSDS